ncbi:MAG: 16S rRNA (cytosine(1402)-N(4))-methyltransferase RsmH [Rhodobacteraceae bacterium]|nr:16S rRNA (cytosine(1402)-N(4))-methyltransferase RsmH [Paracoccaceae bacterium]
MAEESAPNPLETARDAAAALHAPVLLAETLEALSPESGGVFVDATFGAGGYARALLAGGADLVIGIDRDPEAIARGRAWAELHDGRLRLAEGCFSELEALTRGETDRPIDGIAFDLGVSSMQLDEARRGFSFMRDGPLDMRMGDEGDSAADLVNRLDEGELADILFHYGEERASRRIARAIVGARREAPIETTARLAEIVASRLPRPKPGQPHPATRSFQGLRIAVNDELREIEDGLAAAERVLTPGGRLAAVSFHSLEDRLVKRFLADRCNRAPRGSRHTPDVNPPPATFNLIVKGARGPSDAEVAANPRSRSAKLRAARRTEAAAR